MLPDVRGLLGLDIGCGEGHNTRLLAGRGARVVAVDIARPSSTTPDDWRLRSRWAYATTVPVRWSCRSPMRASTSPPAS